MVFRFVAPTTGADEDGWSEGPCFEAFDVSEHALSVDATKALRVNFFVIHNTLARRRTLGRDILPASDEDRSHSQAQRGRPQTDAGHTHGPVGSDHSI